uniref:Immunoglobulin V-set domain-containing protein n=1 Tax=Nothoprocta perdicaria TaxID=30464 RepID=A0A8C6YZS7_NOTPE
MLLIWTFLLSAGENLALIVEIPQDLINGTVGQSVLLPISYKFNNISLFPLAIQWAFNNPSNWVISCTVHNCSVGPDGVLKNCSASYFSHNTYRGRVVLFPENASLLLRDLQLSDSGVYIVTFKQQILTKNITLTVHSPHFNLKNPGECDFPKMCCNYCSCSFRKHTTFSFKCQTTMIHRREVQDRSLST